MGETRKSIGEVSEAVVMAEFLKAGFPVLLPFGDSQRYDLVVEAGRRFLRVQCKTASPCGWRDDRSCIRFKARSGTHHSVLYRGQVDLFAAYAPSTRQVYVLAVDEVPETDVWLRLMPAKNNQHLRIRRAWHGLGSAGAEAHLREHHVRGRRARGGDREGGRSPANQHH